MVVKPEKSTQRKNTHLLGSVIFVGVVIVWISYPIIITSFDSPWPNQNWNTNLAPFGDSFGALNALFSGLAFAAVTIALLLQKDGLRDTREQFVLSMRLSALGLMVADCDRGLAELAEKAARGHWNGSSDNDSRNFYTQKRNILIDEIDFILTTYPSLPGSNFTAKLRELNEKFKSE